MVAYSLDQAQKDIAGLRGVIAHLLANAEFLNLTASTEFTAPDGSTWTSSGLNMSGALKYGTIPVYHAAATGNLSVTGTEADVPGASVSVVVRGNSSTVVVIGVFDEQTNASSSASVSGFLNWNGSDRSEQAVTQTGDAAAVRGTVAQCWVITGVTAGTYTAKLRGSGTTGGTIRGTHTTITAMVWEGQ
jgi:hypothetical protein